MQTKSIVLAAMALISATTASSVKWCNEYNQKGDCDTVDASTFCTAIPDSNAKGDTGSSAQLMKKGDVNLCTYYESFDCTGNGIDFTGKHNLDQGWQARTFFCKAT